MINISAMLDLQVQMFTIMAIGFLTIKKHILPEASRDVLTKLLIQIILPANIIYSFFIEFSWKVLQQCGVIFIIAFVFQLSSFGIAKFLYRKEPKEKQAVLKYGIICSNAGFMGNSIIEVLYGTSGLLLTSMYLIPQRVMMWTMGVSFFTHKEHKKWISICKHPCIFAVFIGICSMLTQISIPSALYASIKSLSNCTMGISMLLIGIVLGENTKAIALDFKVLLYTFLRLFLLPLLVFLGCRIFSVDMLATGIAVILAGMPAGSTTAILASQYKGDVELASTCVVVSTLLSLLSIPLWCSFLNLF